ncbi:MAG: 16S rRNA (cytosine(1402)-N(4))-methyltransferase RsmH [Spirochaetales bacterium]|nr:16S rRNA (cytosine(1402)-N(4))-methyltransferase RsmH [Spirochaetales bacterium]
MTEEKINSFAHTPVLLEEVMSFLRPAHDRAECLLVDGTVGEGGHSEEFLKRFSKMKIICVDADKHQITTAAERLKKYLPRVRFVKSRFSDFFNNYDVKGNPRPDRILLDLGISMFHFKESGRGFSFQKDEKLDMRLSNETKKTAASIINNESEQEIARILFEYGEERASRRIARAIVEARKQSPIKTTTQLAGIVKKAVGQAGKSKINPATKTFQALRIAVNHELEELKAGLEKGFSILSDHGRMGVISFHSLEDRIVKWFFKDKARECICPSNVPICQCRGKKELVELTKKPIVPGSAEMKSNPASRSAKLRVVEKCL